MHWGSISHPIHLFGNKHLSGTCFMPGSVQKQTYMVSSPCEEGVSSPFHK